MRKDMNTPKTTKTTTIQVRVPVDLKERTNKLFAELGTTTSAVINMMLVQADRTQSIPFRIVSPTNIYGLTPEESVEEIKATYALEGMPLSEEDVEELLDIEYGRKTSEEVREKIIKDIKDRQRRGKL